MQVELINDDSTHKDWAMWPSNLVDFIKALHNVDVVWRPSTQEEECPF